MQSFNIKQFASRGAAFFGAIACTLFVLNNILGIGPTSNLIVLENSVLSNAYGRMPGYSNSVAECLCTVSTANGLGYVNYNTSCNCSTLPSGTVCNTCQDTYLLTGYYSGDQTYQTIQPNGGNGTSCTTGSFYGGSCTTTNGCTPLLLLGGCTGSYQGYTYQLGGL